MPTVQTVLSAEQRKELKTRAKELGLSESRLAGLCIQKGLKDDEFILKLARLEHLIKALKNVCDG